jgi:TrmH family RNA methyltransferase
MIKLKLLKTKKGRDEAGLFLVEGEKFVAEIPDGVAVERYVVSQEYAAAHDLSRYEQRARCEIVRDSLFAALADTVTPQGVIAVCEKISYKLEDILSDSSPFILLCEGINDPGNAGTLIRTAAAAGVTGVIFSAGSCDIFSPKVLRAAAGAVLRLPIVQNVDAGEAFAALQAGKISIYAAHPRGDKLPYDVDLRAAACILVGSESHGISAGASAAASALVRLPMTTETESLNASVAGSILMYEAVRQRGMK